MAKSRQSVVNVRSRFCQSMFLVLGFSKIKKVYIFNSLINLLELSFHLFKMILNPGFLIDIQELDEIIQGFDDAIATNSNNVGIIDQRFDEALILIDMLFEKNELSEQVDTLSNNLGEFKENFKLLNKLLNWYRTHHKRLLAYHQNLRG